MLGTIFSIINFEIFLNDETKYVEMPMFHYTTRVDSYRITKLLIFSDDSGVVFDVYLGPI